MPRFGRPLFLQLVLALVLVFAGLFAANHFLLDRVYLLDKKLQFHDLTPSTPADDRASLAAERNWVLVELPFSRNEEALNERLGALLDREGMPLRRFWLTAEVLATLDSGQIIQEVWSQGAMNMSFLVRAFVVDGQLVVAGTALAHSREITAVADRFLAMGLVAALLTLTGLVFGFVRAPTIPLLRLSAMADALTRLEFPTLGWQTPDEVGDLARKMDAMSRSLAAVHAQSQDRNRDLEYLLTQLGHELKTPLTILQGHLAALEEGITVAGRWQTMGTQVAKIDRLVTQTLALTRADRVELSLQTFDLGDLVRRVHNELGTRGQGRLRITVAPGPGLVVFSDPQALEVVLTNLLGNALAHGAGGAVEVTLVPGADSVGVSIANATDGALTAADLERFGRPLVPLSRGRTGLGLYLAKTLLDRMGIAWTLRLLAPDRLEIAFLLGRTMADSSATSHS